MVRAQRDSFGEALISVATAIDDLVVVDADNAPATRIAQFATQFPARYLNVGVSEQNLVGIACGLALCGRRPVAVTFAVFLCGRAFEVIRNGVALNSLPVVLVGTHAGVSVGRDGPSHFAVEDIALMRSLPNMRVVVPADGRQVAELLSQSLKEAAPTYLRISRWGTPEVTPAAAKVTLGKRIVLADGEDCCIIACGLMVHAAVVARDRLDGLGISCAVVAIHTVKPLDQPLIQEAASRCRRLVVRKRATRLRTALLSSRGSENV